jgi:hypothetical protein
MNESNTIGPDSHLTARTIDPGGLSCIPQPIQPKRKYDSTVARIAGNIAAGLVDPFCRDDDEMAGALAARAVRIARAIVSEVERTDPPRETGATT